MVVIAVDAAQSDKGLS